MILFVASKVHMRLRGGKRMDDPYGDVKVSGQEEGLTFNFVDINMGF